MDASYYVLPKVIESIKSDNVLITCILTMIAIMGLNFAGKISEKVINYAIELTSSLKFRKAKGRYIIDVDMNMNYNASYHNMPLDYLGLLYFIHKNDINIKIGRKIPEFKLISNTSYTAKEMDFYKSDKIIDYFLESNEPLKITNKIFLDANKKDNDKISSSDKKGYEFVLYSYDYNFKELKEIVTKWSSDYDTYLKKIVNNDFYHFTYINLKIDNPINMYGLGNNNNEKTSDKSKVDYTNKYDLQQHYFKTNKNFENIFFEDKEKLKNKLDFFCWLNPIKLLKDLQSTANQVHENERVAAVVVVAVGRKEVRLLLFPSLTCCFT